MRAWCLIFRVEPFFLLLLGGNAQSSVCHRAHTLHFHECNHNVRIKSDYELHNSAQYYSTPGRRRHSSGGCRELLSRHPTSSLYHSSDDCKLCASCPNDIGHPNVEIICRKQPYGARGRLTQSSEPTPLETDYQWCGSFCRGAFGDGTISFVVTADQGG